MEMVSDMHVRIMLMCAFGVDFSQEELDFEHDWKVEKKPVSFVLRTTVHECLNRVSDPHVIIFPFLNFYYLRAVFLNQCSGRPRVLRKQF